MRITSTLWYQALVLEKECAKRSEVPSREIISEVLKVPENTAREIRFALENKDIIQMRPHIVGTTHEMVELIIADTHFPYHDQVTWDCVLAYAEKLPITDITLLGDMIDMYDISIFSKTDKAQKKSIKGEITTTTSLLTELRSRFPNATIRYKQGNHEYRMDRYIMDRAEEIADLLENFLPAQLKLHELGITYIIEPFKIGKLWHLHGDEFRAGGGVQKVCSKAWGFVHDHFVLGHFHRTDSETKVHIDPSVLFNLNSIGWMGSHEAANYARLNTYNQGFAVVEYAINGNFRVHNHRVLCGEIF